MTVREQFEEWCKKERNHNDLHRTKKHPSVPSSVADEYMNPVVELAWQAYQAGYTACQKANRELAAKVCEPIGEDGDDEDFDHREGVTDLEKETILTLVRVFDASLRTNNEPEIVEAFMQAAELIDRLKARGLIRRSPITQAEELKAAMERLYGSDSTD